MTIYSSLIIQEAFIHHFHHRTQKKSRCNFVYPTYKSNLCEAAGCCQVITSAARTKQGFWLAAQPAVMIQCRRAMRVFYACTRGQVRCSILCCRGGVYEGPVQSGMVGAPRWGGVSFLWCRKAVGDVGVGTGSEWLWPMRRGWWTPLQPLVLFIKTIKKCNRVCLKYGWRKT